MKNAIATVALVSCFTAACKTASPPEVPANLLACEKLEDPGARIKCYDTQVAAMNRPAATAGASAAVASPPPSTSTSRPPASAAVPPPAAPPAPPPPAAAIPTPAAAGIAPAAGTARAQQGPPPATAAAANQSLTEQFGAEQLPPSSRPVESRKAEVLHSSITGIREPRPNSFVISLSNGQAWLENEAEMTRLLHVGDDVSITKGSLGSYHLWTASTGAKNWVLVKRIQ